MQTTINAVVRQESGKEKCGRMRKVGRLPGVVYGQGKDPVQLEFETHAMNLFFSHPRTAVIDLVVAGAGEEKVVVKEVQRHVVNHQLSHIDLLRISMSESVGITVQIVLEGEPAAIKLGGILLQHLTELDIEGLPGNLPEKIHVDISSLGVGENITVGDLKLPEGISVVGDEEEVVCSIETNRAESDDAEEEDAAPAPAAKKKAAE